MNRLLKKKKNRAVRVLVTAIILFAAAMSLTLSRPVKTKADMATDTLEILVGYSGMQTNEYVSVATYHWAELLDRCRLDSQAYSYFQRKLDGINYNAIVDCANGFYISDILNISNVYIGDIYNIMFYVRDAQGIWTAFDYYSLFGARYYYPNLASHRHVHYRTYEDVEQREVYETVPVTELVDVYETKEIVETVPVLDEEGKPVLDEEGNPKTEEKITYEQVPVYNEDGTIKQEEVPVYNADGSVKTEQVPVYNADGTIKTEPVTVTKTDYSTITGYTFEEAERFGVPVAPMLAIEDNWKTFNQDFDNIYEDFYNMTTSHRFRLLFGQINPTESLTRESANYVSALYITLAGMPVYGDITEGGKYGSNTVELEVSSVYNQNMTNQLSQFLDVDSTNEGVIRIDRIETISSDLYSDMARVIVYYSIVGDGQASFAVGVGENGEKKNYSNQANIVVKDGKAEFVNGPIVPEEETGTTPETDPQGGKKDSEESLFPARDTGTEKQVNAEGAAPMNQGNAIHMVDDVTAIKGIYLLSEDVGKELTGAATVEQDVKPGQEITQVRVEDNSKEKQELQKKILLFTGAGVILLCILGGVFEILSFRIRLGKRFIKAEE